MSICKGNWMTSGRNSRRLALKLIPQIQKKIRVNTIVNQGLRLNGEDIKSSSDFCYLCSIVAENRGTSREVNARILKARGSFSKLRRVWLSKSL
jgi:hypothetical protein